jgi:hypothetical protein
LSTVLKSQRFIFLWRKLWFNPQRFPPSQSSNSLDNSLPSMVVSPYEPKRGREMKKLVFAAALTLAATAAQAEGTNQNSRPAQGYTTSGGTSVQPHQQTNSSGTQRGSSSATNTGGTRTPKN